MINFYGLEYLQWKNKNIDFNNLALIGNGQFKIILPKPQPSLGQQSLFANCPDTF